ncbi:MAG TPA: sigma-70 family RNA polymerase sigma factor [Thermomicrobiales bacterium]|nr:sigma-70 family RNA polymerase sigma factor [Thermomicrobiales bacterium]
MGESTTGPNAESDQALLAAVQRRDERAIAALYDRYGGLAFGLAYRILDDRGAAEDVVQDAFMSVWRRAVSFQLDRGSVRTWLLSIVHHRAIDRLRGAAGKSRRDEPLDEIDRIAQVDDPWREVSIRVQGDVLKRGLATLPEAQRQTIELAYFGGYTQQEIATAMDVPVGTVKGRMRIGLQKLRELLSGAGVELT